MSADEASVIATTAAIAAALARSLDEFMLAPVEITGVEDDRFLIRLRSGRVLQVSVRLVAGVGGR